jgi:lysozyme family protein
MEKNNMADFKTAFLITIDPEHEGGYQDMTNDSGNWTGGHVGVGELKGTKYGISAHEFPNEDIKNLTVDRAAEIYQQGYWKQNYSSIQDQHIANKLFDLGVLFGVGTATKVLQTTLGLISVDGIFGPGSLEATNQAEPVKLLAAYKTGMVSHALGVIQAKPEKRPFFADWVRRINS